MPTPHETLALALRLHRAGQLAPAAEHYRALLRSEPAHPDALHLLGQIAQQQGDFATALDLSTRALAAQPRSAPLLLQRGLALRSLGRAPEAIDTFTTATKLQPDLAEAHHQLGNALKSLRHFSDALPPLQTAARLAPGDAAVHLNLGVVYLELPAPDTPAAIASFQRAISLQPGRPEAHNILGHAFSSAGRLGDARRCFTEALRLRPDYAPAHDNLGRLLKIQGRATEAVASFRTALAAQPLPGTHSNLLLALNAAPGLAPADIFAEHRAWDERHSRPFLAHLRPHDNDRDPTRRLRIGYVSPDFSHHAVAFFLEPVLASHHRDRFELYCYSNVATPDRITARLQTLASHWRDIAPLDDDQAAALVRADRIDILVDLAGHTARHRLLLFARKPAPLQFTWLGYPNTTGLTTIDHRITDAISDPPGQTDPWHSEQLVRLPGPFLCYQPPPDAPPVGPLPSTGAGHITFGCFNNYAKVTPETVACWSRLLASVPHSRLLLKSRGLDDPDTATAIRADFATAGIDATRVELDGAQLSVAAHLALYHRVDIALDTFPYNGTTTTFEALWMGAPVVTLAGHTHVSRVGASLLTHLGSPEWIAASTSDYLALATSLASDPLRLAEIRRHLRDRLRASPLCDAPAFTRHLESAFRTTWTRHCSHL